MTGFSAEPHWRHPVRGLIAPKNIYAAIAPAGLKEHLSAHMICDVFTALKSWDAAGYHIPNVTAKFCRARLSDPYLTDKIKWELDRFDLTADRLSVMISDTVACETPNEKVPKNCQKLAALGCQIDLHCTHPQFSSLKTIRQLSIGRLSFAQSRAKQADRAPSQQHTVRNILTLAETAAIETLATGIQIAGEHALLAQLGCNHVQGGGIAEPIPFSQTLNWIDTHNAKLVDVSVFLGRNRQ